MPSAKAMKKIRKSIRKQIEASCRVEARWRFPWRYDPHIKIRPFQFNLLGKFNVRIPLPKLIMPKKGWNEIVKFPKQQFKFKFRFIQDAKIAGKTVELGKG